jgi:hypothetical protein
VKLGKSVKRAMRFSNIRRYIENKIPQNSQHKVCLKLFYPGIWAADYGGSVFLIGSVSSRVDSFREECIYKLKESLKSTGVKESRYS